MAKRLCNDGEITPCLQGVFLSKSSTEKLHFLKSACELGDVNSCLSVAGELGATYWLKACEMGSAEGCLEYAHNGNISPKDKAQFLEKACRLGSSTACKSKRKK